MKSSVFVKSAGAALFAAVFILVGCGRSGEKKSVTKKEAKVEAPSVNTLTAGEKADGWQLLFDGKTFNGWRGIGIKGIPAGHWNVVDGCIHKIGKKDVPRKADGQPEKGGDLITDAVFNDFILTFEWKISKGGNSGVKYNVIEAISIKNGWTGALGYEYQVIDDVNFPGKLTPKHQAAALYDMIAPDKNKVLKPVGEFNSSKKVFIGNHGEHWLNGMKVVEYDIDTPEFQKIFKESKYRGKKDFTRHKIASIVLQDHADECWYRNIKIKRIN
jgi:hypothetical protein